MKAGVLHAVGDLRVEDRPYPGFGETDLLIRVIYNGLCGTDATEYTKGPMMVPLHAPHPGSGHVGPTTLGHEFIGVVVEAGRRERHRIGQRVACGAGVSCGKCAWCVTGRSNLCDRYFTLGLSTHGGLAEFVSAPSSICFEIPDGCSDIDAALAQPLAVAIHSVDRAKLSPGDQVILMGVGAIGSFICSALRGHEGPIIAVDIDADRLKVARQLGATETVQISREATAADVKDFVKGGAQVVFETSGVAGATERALAASLRGGNVVLVGLNKAPQSLNLADVVLREINLLTTVAHVCQADLPAALLLLESQQLSRILPVEVIQLNDVVERGLLPLSRGEVHGKVLVATADG